jgi:sigma-54 dependent transcriptional regulator, acetoin dehydrogenase operon transcriptional activator AcoR
MLFLRKISYRSNILNMRPASEPDERLRAVAIRRKAVLQDGQLPAASDWLEQSWLRTRAIGHLPDAEAVFQPVSRQKCNQTIEENHELIVASQPVLEHLARSIAKTQYFAILTDKNGVVINALGAFDKSDQRASQITATGIDLSEKAVGTTAIGSALAEQKPVWLHRNEHFYSNNRIYSCAGAPIFGTQNECIGMLDLTGIEVPERRELVHLAAQSAKDIQNALLDREVSNTKGLKTLQLQWLGTPLNSANAGKIAFDEDGRTVGFNKAALDWLPDLAANKNQHCEALFSMSSTEFLATLHGGKTATLPLWSGIQVCAQWGPTEASGEANLRNVEAELVQRAITSAKGNVAIAAEKLGISRATLYRKLHKVVKR